MEIPKNSSTPNTEKQKEKAREPDFVSVYEQRLAVAKPIVEAERELTAFEYRDIGLISIEKRVPVVVFEWGDEKNPDYNLWMFPENDPTKRLSHELIRDDLDNEIGRNNENMGLGPYSAYILIGSKGGDDPQKTVYLAVHESFARVIEMESREPANETFLRKWENFMNKYKVDSIVGDFKVALTAGKRSKRMDPEEVLNVDIVGRMMENTELMKVAKEAHLTNYGVMRLFLEYYSAKRTNRGYNLREEAKRLAEETKRHPYEDSDD